MLSTLIRKKYKSNKNSNNNRITHIWETENGNKGNDYSIIVVIIIMINIVIYTDKKEILELYEFK